MISIMDKKKWSVSKRWRRVAGLAGIGIVGLAVMAPINTPTHAQAESAGQALPSVMITVEPAELLSVADMPSAAPGVLAGETKQKPFMTHFPPDLYKAMKEQAVNAPAGVRSPMAPGALAPPTLKTFNFDGVNQTVACNCAPPDPHGAAGKAHFMQVTNSHVDIYSQVNPPVLLKSVTLNVFFGEPTTNFLFDPRVVYDPIWNRWIVVATRGNIGASDPIHKFMLAVSTTANPTGGFFKYSVNFGGGPFADGDFWDYPQLGFDQDAVFVTGNVFSGTGAFKTTAMMPVAKARVYNGLGFGVPIFTGLAPTLAPPIVQDQNANAYFVAANNGLQLHLYNAKHSSTPGEASIVLQALVDVPDYSVPPNAAQPGTAVLLDTLDARFVNASSQVGDSLWNAHSIALGPAAVKWYQIDTEGGGANTLKQSGFTFASGSSADFNASIAANGFNEAFLNWSSVDALNSINAQVRFSGRQPADPANSIGPGAILFQSPTFYLMFGSTSGTARWGDYSAVSLQPQAQGTCAAGRRAWVTNEKIDGNTTWGTRIGKIGFC